MSNHEIRFVVAKDLYDDLTFDKWAYAQHVWASSLPEGLRQAGSLDIQESLIEDLFEDSAYDHVCPAIDFLVSGPVE